MLENSLLERLNSSLPPGDSKNYILTCYVKVKDIYGAYAINSNNVVVNEYFNRSKLYEEGINLFLEISPMIPLGSVISIGSEILNTANCSVVPNCLILNRYNCSKKDFTCGKCMNGFVGESGFRNTICLNASQTVNISSLSISQTTKKCSYNCSNNGNCVYVNNLGKQIEAIDCSIFSNYCRAICVCFPGYYGSACSLSQEQAFLKFAFKDSLMQELIGLVGNTSLDNSNIPYFTTLMRSLTQRPQELLLDTISDAMSVATSIMSV